jgi:hypothetical protein
VTQPQRPLRYGVHITLGDAGFHYTAVGDAPNVTSPSSFEDALNLRVRRGAIQIIAAIAILLVLVAMGLTGRSVGELLSVLVASLPFLFACRWVELRRRRFTLRYDLPNDVGAAWANVIRATERLGASSLLKHERTADRHGDWKRHAGADTTVELGPATIDTRCPSTIDADARPVHFSAGGREALLFPDRLLMWSNGRFIVTALQDMTIEASDGRFRWGTSVPRGAEVIEWTWQYVNKRGGPDLRFNDNARVAVLRVGYFTLGAPNGPTVEIMAGNTDAVDELRAAIHGYLKEVVRCATSVERYEASVERALDTFRLGDIPTVDQLRTRFRALAKERHPDRVAQFGAAATAAAEEAFKELNAAHEALGAVARRSGPDAPEKLDVEKPVRVPLEPPAERWRELALHRAAPFAAAAVASIVLLMGMSELGTVLHRVSTAQAPAPQAVAVVVAAEPESPPPRARPRVLRSRCGAAGASPPAERLVADWAEYECATEAAIGDAWSDCLARSEYADEAGAGCPGARRCCPPTIDSEGTRDDEDVEDDVAGFEAQREEVDDTVYVGDEPFAAPTSAPHTTSVTPPGTTAPPADSPPP